MPRRPRPTALKLLQGQRPSRINDDEPPFAPGAPAKPAGLTDEAVGETWDAIVDVLEQVGVLSAGDGYALWTFAQRWSDFEKAAHLVNTVGPLIVDEHRQPRRNPAVILERDAGRDVLAWCKEFGMTPAARSQIRARLAGGSLPQMISDAVADRFLG